MCQTVRKSSINSRINSKSNSGSNLGMTWKNIRFRQNWRLVACYMSYITVAFHIADVQACVTPHARDVRLRSKKWKACCKIRNSNVIDTSTAPSVREIQLNFIVSYLLKYLLESSSFFKPFFLFFFYHSLNFKRASIKLIGGLNN